MLVSGAGSGSLDSVVDFAKGSEVCSRLAALGVFAIRAGHVQLIYDVVEGLFEFGEVAVELLVQIEIQRVGFCFCTLGLLF